MFAIIFNSFNFIRLPAVSPGLRRHTAVHDPYIITLFIDLVPKTLGVELRYQFIRLYTN